MCLDNCAALAAQLQQQLLVWLRQLLQMNHVAGGHIDVLASCCCPRTLRLPCRLLHQQMAFQDYFSLIAFFIFLRETLEASVIIAVLLQCMNRTSPRLKKQGELFNSCHS
jgi:hypothetical protein